MSLFLSILPVIILFRCIFKPFQLGRLRLNVINGNLSCVIMTDVVLACPLLGLNHSGSPRAQKSSQSPVQPSQQRKVPKVQITKHRRQAPTQCGGSQAGWRQREKYQKSTHYKTSRGCNQSLCCLRIKLHNEG